MHRREFLHLTTAAALVPSGCMIGAANDSIADAASPDASPNASQVIFTRIVERAKHEGWHGLPIGQCMAHIGKEFVGTRYVAGTLEAQRGEHETCKAVLTGLDCVTLVETVLSLARMLKRGKSSFDDLLHELTFTRYRSGIITDYTSRLHYTSDWFADNIHKGVVRSLEQELQGEPLVLRVEFMSRHAERYPALQALPARIHTLRSIEECINTRSHWYVPKERVGSIEKHLLAGDIVGIVTAKHGLDYSHTGLIVRDTDHNSSSQHGSSNSSATVRLLHASLRKQAVVVDTALSVVVAAHPAARGITVVRPQEPHYAEN